jgi:RNase P/RNase MRP subunit p29
MQKLQRKTRSLAMSLAAAALLTLPAGAAAQTAGEPEKQAPAPEQQQAAPVQRAVPHVTGKVTRQTRSRLDLETAEGKMEKVAVNKDTEWLVEVKEGTEVTVEYRRRISGFVIAERVLPARDATAAAQNGGSTAPAPAAQTVTGSIVSSNSAALLLRTEAGDVTLFLSPSTAYLVKPLDPGMRVTAEYREGADGAKVATRVLTAEAKAEDSATGENGSE